MELGWFGIRLGVRFGVRFGVRTGPVLPEEAIEDVCHEARDLVRVRVRLRGGGRVGVG